ncbi:putative aminopeptidase npepl1 [Perkinsus olseni]|uniref:Putative aminopeptidase npepl1 n=1 Tax=Perkinsus olseni TaxID=32597 RepID=A0A7J6NWS2_PEROL|nr:putative aminopeptidase npepl1 [Perkinsus olseni]
MDRQHLGESSAKRLRRYDPVDQLLLKEYGQRLEFLDREEALTLSSSSTIFVVGQMRALAAFASDPKCVVAKINDFVRAEAGSPSRASQTVAFVRETDGLRKVVVVGVPAEATRNNKLNFNSKRAMRAKNSSESCVVVWSAEGRPPHLGRRGKLELVVDNIRMAALLTEMPTNQLNTTTYTRAIEGVAGRLRDRFGADIGLEIIKGQELERQGFGGLWNVGKACTANPPALVVLSWNASNAKPDGKSIVLVGKGIVYDTGGLALKTKDGMMGMKTDMGGSAGLLGAFAALVETKAIVNESLYFIGCLAENSIGPDSYRHGDVIGMYSGLTVEINNTDCEGRLVLADGVAYAAKHLNPELIIDMATLTYAQGVATGLSHGAIFSNCADTEKKAFEAGRRSGDLVFPVLFCPEVHKPQLHSDIADLKNQPTPGAGCSCAGSFIYENLIAAVGGDSVKFLHVDMAAVCSNLEGRASGFGVALVSQLLGALD